MEWANGNNQKGILLTGDIIQVTADTNWVSFMYSYPNSFHCLLLKLKKWQTGSARFNLIGCIMHSIVW